MTEGDLEALRARLRGTPVGEPPPAGFRRAGVLVPILLGVGGPELLLTVRAAHLRHHAGQIAFPGGGAEPGETPEDAARREAFEEVGLEVPADALLGRLGALASPAGYVATPVVAAVAAPARLRLDPSEVAEAFTVPLRDLRTLVPSTSVRPFRGHARTLHHYRWRDREIWGFTGNVLRELLARLEGDERAAARPAPAAEARP